MHVEFEGGDLDNPVEVRSGGLDSVERIHYDLAIIATRYNKLPTGIHAHFVDNARVREDFSAGGVKSVVWPQGFEILSLEKPRVIHT